MKKIVYVCDKCNNKYNEIKPNVPSKDIAIYISVGTQPDVAGGPTEHITQRIDLCHSCTSVLCQNLINNMEKDKIIEIIQSMKIKFSSDNYNKPEIERYLLNG